MVYFDESGKMMKINGKVDKSNSNNGLLKVLFRSLFMEELLQIKMFSSFFTF